MSFDRRLTNLEAMFGKCPACDGKQRIVVIDDADDGNGAPGQTSASDPEHCIYCGGLRNTVTIRIMNEHPQIETPAKFPFPK